MKRVGKHSIAAMLATLAGTGLLVSSCVSQPAPLSSGGGTCWYRVENAPSPDTILVNGIGRVKYIGVASPGRRPPGERGETLREKALEKNRELVEGKWVRLEFDSSSHDAAGRCLAYVFVQQDDLWEIFVNGEMLRLGLASLEESTVNVRYLPRLRALEARARQQRLGIWSQRDP